MLLYKRIKNYIVYVFSFILNTIIKKIILGTCGKPLYLVFQFSERKILLGQ
jgi:hypothetical protein